MLRQQLQQKLQQKLSPLQIQEIKLLQVPTYALDARIKEELETNPALEDATLSDDFETKIEDKDDAIIDENIDSNDTDLEDAAFDEDWYYDKDEKKDYSYQESVLTNVNNFRDFLHEQLGVVDLSDKDFQTASIIIDSIDDDGYLRRPTLSLIDDMAFTQNLYVQEHEVESMIQLVQSFEPAGICARNLGECLSIQLKQKLDSTPTSETLLRAISIVESHLDDITNKRFDKLVKELDISINDLKSIISEITKLNPKPGDSILNHQDSKNTIIPDFIVSSSEKEITLSLNTKNTPELHVSRTYQEMLQEYESISSKNNRNKEAVEFVKSKIDAANWFINALKQREQTLMKTMQSIILFQQDFFRSGSDNDLRPMKLKDLSESIGMDISTISRVINSKYVKTDFGIFKLKYFFSEGLMNNDGNFISSKEIKSIIRDFIEEEDKKNPITDDQLTESLNAKGYNIARRTVAKYRENLGIPVARLRKEV